MNVLEIKTTEGVKESQFPEKWVEASESQFVCACKALVNETYFRSADFIKEFLALSDTDFQTLTPFARYAIREQCGFIFEEQDYRFKTSKVPQMAIAGTTYWGILDNFSNITWEEFLYADQFLIQQEYENLCAVIYRPEKKHWDGESDRRIPFTIFGMRNRLELFKQVNYETLAAAVINYRAMRLACLEDKYHNIFSSKDELEKNELEDDEQEEETPEQEKEEINRFSWVNIHRNLLGDNVHEEYKFLRLPVHTVLHRLNALIEENRKYKK